MEEALGSFFSPELDPSTDPSHHTTLEGLSCGKDTTSRQARFIFGILSRLSFCLRQNLILLSATRREHHNK